MASTNIVNLIGSIINLIRDTNTCTITNVGTTYTIHTTDTKRLVVGDWVKISGNDYKITSLTNDVSFTITSATAVVGTSWTALAPYYYYGTPIMISNTLDKIKDYQNKYPVIVLFETMPATVSDTDELIERTVKLEMYAMDEANFADWTHEEYYTNVIDKMQAYIDSFIEALGNHSQIGEFDSHEETNWSKWNLVVVETGKNVFNAQLSGIQLNIDLPIKRILACADV